MRREDRGVYVLVIDLKTKTNIKVGKLGMTTLSPGTYLYVGRAKRYLNGRLKRHLRQDKKNFWHIDYLLQHACLKDIWIKPGFFEECHTAAMIQSACPEASCLVSKFGSSDCRCPSHLFYLAEQTRILPQLRSNLKFEKVKKNGH